MRDDKVQLMELEHPMWRNVYVLKKHYSYF
jgi:hypothetical protein